LSPRKIEFTRHLFATLTYTRDKTSDERWATVSKDFNRYFQNYRRLHNDVEYLRVLESHKDNYPHIHCIIQFPDARIRVENTRYFDRMLYAKWRVLWQHGHSDYQKPRRSGVGTISYVMKYLLKNQTQKTVWRKLLASCATVPGTVETSIEDNLPNAKDTSVTALMPRLPVKYKGQKLCTWSRRFDFSVFSARRPESIVKGLKATAN
jgi:hypothetical protein